MIIIVWLIIRTYVISVQVLLYFFKSDGKGCDAGCSDIYVDTDGTCTEAEEATEGKDATQAEEATEVPARCKPRSHESGSNNAKIMLKSC